VAEVPPLPELDISDTEKTEQRAADGLDREGRKRRHAPRCSLWRTARERAVWLYDVNSSTAAARADALAYAAAVYADRCRPLLEKAAKQEDAQLAALQPSKGPSAPRTRGDSAASGRASPMPNGHRDTPDPSPPAGGGGGEAAVEDTFGGGRPPKRPRTAPKKDRSGRGGLPSEGGAGATSNRGSVGGGSGKGGGLKLKIKLGGAKQAAKEPVGGGNGETQPKKLKLSFGGNRASFKPGKRETDSPAPHAPGADNSDTESDM